MNYLYHRMPLNMQGDTLYPLNTLKDKWPEIYKEEITKYESREPLLARQIPQLKCLWNDVIHLTAVDPKVLYTELKDVGFNPPPRKFYIIDPYDLEPEATIIYLNQHLKKGPLAEEDVAVYNPASLEQYSHFPTHTKNYYKESFSKGEKPLLYHGIPHILYKGSINITKYPLVEV